MVQQIQAHERREKQQLRAVENHQDLVFTGMLKSYGKVLVVLILTGAALVLYFQPAKHLWRRSERLPPRKIVTLYPSHLNVLEALPRFFLGYGTYCTYISLQLSRSFNVQRSIIKGIGSLSTNNSRHQPVCVSF